MKKYSREILICTIFSLCSFILYFYAYYNGFKFFINEAGATWSNSTPFGAIHHK